MQRYLLNFIFWWYLINGVDLLRFVTERIIFILEITNTLPMAQNLTVPMFQDTSGAGRMLSVMIRFGWVWVGGLFSLLFAVPLIILYLIYLALPVIIIVEIFLFIISIKR